MQGRVAWERFQLGEELIGVRSEILTSWRRSRLSGVDPTEPNLPHTDADFDSRFARMAIPVMSATAELLGTTDTCLAITNSAGVVLWRWTSDSALRSALDDSGLLEGSAFGEEHAGTNGLGTALELGRVAAVHGEEHFKEHFHRFACVAAPVAHPLTRRTVGAVNITCPVEDANQMLEPTIVKLVREIRHALLEAAGVRERKLFDEFLSERAKGANPVITLSPDVIIKNHAASELQLEHQLLWSQVLDSLETGSRIDFPDGRSATLRPLSEGQQLTGAVLILGEPPHTPVAAEPEHEILDTDERMLRLAERAWAENRCVVLRGEQGAGKTYLTRRLLARFPDSRLVEARELLSADGLASLSAEIETTQPALAVEGLDRVPLEQLRDELLPLLRSWGDVLPVAMTWTSSQHDMPGSLAVVADELEPAIVDVPALRLRREELKSLVAGVLGKPGWVTSAAMAVLYDHTWPGNMTELRFAMSRAIEESGGARIEVAHLPRYLWHQTSSRRLTPLERAEASVIAEAIAANGGNKSAAAKELGVSRPTLYSKIRSYRL
ncbi:helix-turn-helix domain-containing protein [Pseudonocardia yuanmonensis]|uniref:Helix-turn-helix domain-containing protein n=2 Tax=Pseudonocardia yuanmonensis TaxID=1095914 RepID=A0ABP8WJI7_9PSEU